MGDMDLLLDMIPDEYIVYNGLEKGKSNEYYQGQAEHILKHIDTKEHYFYFLQTILKNYHILDDTQKKRIQDTIGILPIIQEKVVIKEKIIYKQPKRVTLNTYDDY